MQSFDCESIARKIQLWRLHIVPRKSYFDWCFSWRAMLGIKVELISHHLCLALNTEQQSN